MKTRLFVDMDGTLAVFRKYITNLEALYEPGYFSSLLPNTNVLLAVKEIIAKYSDKIELFVCSAYLSDSEYAFDEKNEWLDKFLPELDSAHRILMPCGKNKTEYIPGGIRESDVILDDLSKNLHEWNAAGGRGIKLLNGINGTIGTWRGESISYLNVPKVFADRLTFAILNNRPIKDSLPQNDMSGIGNSSEQRLTQLYFDAVRKGNLTDVVRISNILYMDFAKVVKEPLQERDFKPLNVTFDNTFATPSGKIRTIDLDCEVRKEKKRLSYTFDTNKGIYSKNIPDDVYMLMLPGIDEIIAKKALELADVQKDLETPDLEERE